MFGRPGISPFGYPSMGYQGLKTGINWGTIFTNTQKTLGFINQAVPAFYQVKPIWNNCKTMFKVAKELRTDDSRPSATSNNNSNNYHNVNTINQRLDGSTNFNTDNNVKPRFFV